MGLAYFPTWIVDFNGKLVAKYTSPMNPVRLLGYLLLQQNLLHHSFPGNPLFFWEKQTFDGSILDGI